MGRNYRNKTVTSSYNSHPRTHFTHSLVCPLSERCSMTEQRDVSSPSHFPNCKLNVLNMQSFGPRTVADHKPANSLVLGRQPRASIATALL